MAEHNFNVKFSANTQQLVNDINKLLVQLKSSLGNLGKNIELIDTKQFKSEMVEVEKHLDKTANQLKNIKPPQMEDLFNPKTMLGSVFMLNQMTDLVRNLSEGLDMISDPAVKFEASLAELSSITGVAGKDLEQFGESARKLAQEFGGSALSQIDAFKGILSRLGPDLAKSPAAMEKLTIAVNTLGKAGGLDASQAMDALTTTMLQFGISLDDPIKAADEATRIINVLAAGAKEGAAEIPQVSDALVVAGVEAKKANLSIEETNASIQTLATGGKYGAEAGTALRNVLSKLAGEDIIPKEALTKLKSLGVNFNIVSDTTRPFAERLTEMKKALKDSTALAQVFGTENSSAATILIQNADKVADFTEKLTGTNTAFEQAAINMDTTAGKTDRFKAVIEDVLLTLGQGLGGGFLQIQKGATALMPMVLTMAQMKAVMPTEAIAGMGKTMISKLVPAAMSVNQETGKQVVNFKKLASTLLTNPYFIAIAGLTALVFALDKASKAYIQTATAATEEAKSHVTSLEKQKELTAVQIKNAQGNKKLIDDYIRVGAEVEKTGVKTDEYNKIVRKLGKTYPEVFDLQRPYSENVKKLKDSAVTLSAENQKQVQSNVQLINQYESLSQKTERTTQEEAKLRETKEKLNGIYPGVIGNTKSLSEEFRILKERANQTTNEVVNLQRAYINLDNQTRAAQLQKFRAMREEAIASMTVAIEKGLNVDGIINTAGGAIMDGVTSYANDLGSLISNVTKGNFEKASDDYERAVSGVSLAKGFVKAGIASKDAEIMKTAIQKEFAPKIRAAFENAEDVDKTQQSLINMIWSDKRFKGLSSKVKEDLEKFLNSAFEPQRQALILQGKIEFEPVVPVQPPPIDKPDDKPADKAKEDRSKIDEALKKALESRLDAERRLNESHIADNFIREKQALADKLASEVRKNNEARDAAIKNEKLTADEKLKIKSDYEEANKLLKIKFDNDLLEIDEKALKEMRENAEKDIEDEKKRLEDLQKAKAGERQADLAYLKSLQPQFTDVLDLITQSFMNMKKEADGSVMGVKFSLDGLEDSIEENAVNIAVSFGQMWGKMLVDSKTNIKEMILAVLSGIEAIIPLLVVEIFGKAIATNLWVGLAEAIGFSALLYGMLEAAKSGVQSLATGGGPFTDPQLVMVGDAPGHAEFVFRDDQVQKIITVSVARAINMMRGLYPENKELQTLQLVNEIRELTDSIHELKPFFKVNEFTARNLVDFMRNYSKHDNIQADYMRGKLNSVDFEKLIKPVEIKIRSFASGGTVDSPELILAGDSPRGPEHIFDNPALLEVIKAANGMTQPETLSRLERIEEAINNITIIVGDETIYNSNNRQTVKEKRRIRS